MAPSGGYHLSFSLVYHSHFALFIMPNFSQFVTLFVCFAAVEALTALRCLHVKLRSTTLWHVERRARLFLGAQCWPGLATLEIYAIH